MAKSQSGPRINTCPYNTGGTRFFRSAEGSYLYKQPTNLPLPNLSVRILCQVSFQLSVSYDWLSCTSHHDDQTGNWPLPINYSVLLYGANMHLVYYRFFFFSVRWLSVQQYFLMIVLVVCQLIIFHNIPVLTNSSVKTVSGTLKKTL